MRQHPKPKYKVNHIIVGRVHHLGDNLPNEIVMIQIESARYDTQYGHWIYCGSVEHAAEFGTRVEIYEWDVERRLK